MRRRNADDTQHVRQNNNTKPGNCCSLVMTLAHSHAYPIFQYHLDS